MQSLPPNKPVQREANNYRGSFLIRETNSSGKPVLPLPAGKTEGIGHKKE